MGKPLVPESVRISQINAKPNVEFVRWSDGYKNCNSKAVCVCTIHNYEWAAAVTDLVNRGQGCPQCGGKRKWTAEERMEQINGIEKIKFIGWVGEYRGRASKAVCECLVDGNRWGANVGDLLGKGSGCPECKRVATGERQRTPEAERISQVNAQENISFIRWDGKYRNQNSKAVCRCTICENVWSSSVYSLTSGHGCPSCARGGYDKGKHGTLYALRSSCGSMVKIGISNNYKKRHDDLKCQTPFDWECIELLHGDGAVIYELERIMLEMTTPAPLSKSFSGHTEWRLWDPRIPKWFDDER